MHFRIHGELIRLQALLGDWSGYEQTEWAEPADEMTQNGVYFSLVRLALWRNDKARAAQILARTEPLDFDLKPRVAELARLILDGVVTDALRVQFERWAKISGRARRRPIFFRQLAAEVNAHVGDEQTMFEMLESADSLGLLDLFWLDRCPPLAPYRGAPRFAAVRAHTAERAAEVVRILG
jgi:hypothetical protein